MIKQILTEALTHFDAQNYYRFVLAAAAAGGLKWYVCKDMPTKTDMERMEKRMMPRDAEARMVAELEKRMLQATLKEDRVLYKYATYPNKDPKNCVQSHLIRQEKAIEELTERMLTWQTMTSAEHEAAMKEQRKKIQELQEELEACQTAEVVTKRFWQ
eukprot:TRINITY_DN53_c0_g1_i1.p1 TRINITY_DN53_c0_g1~~TRINITY_DN53_c0_g1_i1.p1  ORF type:complete len:158 (+),score=17.37 TRINITY_DN53_c0_g1_i1:44-517(+)